MFNYCSIFKIHTISLLFCRSRIFKFFSWILWLWSFLYLLNFVSFLYCIVVFVVLKLIFRAQAAGDDTDQVLASHI